MKRALMKSCSSGTSVFGGCGRVCTQIFLSPVCCLPPPLRNITPSVRPLVMTQVRERREVTKGYESWCWPHKKTRALKSPCDFPFTCSSWFTLPWTLESLGWRCHVSWRLKSRAVSLVQTLCSAPLSIRAEVPSPFKPQTQVIFPSSIIFILFMDFIAKPNFISSHASHLGLSQLCLMPVG